MLFLLLADSVTVVESIWKKIKYVFKKPITKILFDDMGRHLFTAHYTCFRTTFMTKSNRIV